MILADGTRIPTSIPLWDDDLHEALEQWLTETRERLEKAFGNGDNATARRILKEQTEKYFSIRGLDMGLLRQVTDKDAHQLYISVNNFFVE